MKAFVGQNMGYDVGEWTTKEVQKKKIHRGAVWKPIKTEWTNF